MATIQRFEDLQIWQEARSLSKKLYQPIKNDFRFKDQVRVSCGSIMDNIAEGFERGSKLEFVSALTIAKGETGEFKSQLYRALNNNYVSEEVFKDLYDLADKLTKMLTSVISYLNQSKIKEQKFKNRT